MSGFDKMDVARESPSGQRETLIRNDAGQSYIVATYSITDARKEKVDFAGPYLITGQSLLVRADDTDITGAEWLQNNKKLCSVSGSTPAQRSRTNTPACSCSSTTPIRRASKH